MRSWSRLCLTSFRNAACHQEHQTADGARRRAAEKATDSTRGLQTLQDVGDAGQHLGHSWDISRDVPEGYGLSVCTRSGCPSAEGGRKREQEQIHTPTEASAREARTAAFAGWLKHRQKGAQVLCPGKCEEGVQCEYHQIVPCRGWQRDQPGRVVIRTSYNRT